MLRCKASWRNGSTNEHTHTSATRCRYSSLLTWKSQKLTNISFIINVMDTNNLEVFTMFQTYILQSWTIQHQSGHLFLNQSYKTLVSLKSMANNVEHFQTRCCFVTSSVSRHTPSVHCFFNDLAKHTVQLHRLNNNEYNL